MRFVPNSIQATTDLINGYTHRHTFAAFSAAQSEGEAVLAGRGEELGTLKSNIHLSSIGSVRTSDVARSTAVPPFRASCVAIPRIAA